MSVPILNNDRTLTTITSLCTDLRGFSELHENLTPMVLADLLDVYYAETAAIVADAGGHVDTFLGDSVLAHFTTSPDDAANAATRAVTAGLRMKAAIAQRWPTIAMSIGIATGEAVVGHFGPASHRFHTALGSVVSRAAALERRSHKSDFTVLVDRTTRDQLTGPFAITAHVHSGEKADRHEEMFEVRTATATLPERL
jgi:class 3 adenylate cyclase